MGSIEGVIILSPTDEPILHSHFLHPLPNYPILHVDQLAAKLEATALKEDALPLYYTDEIPQVPEEVDEEGTEDEEGEARNVEESEKTGSALVQIQHNQLRLVATFSQHGEWQPGNVREMCFTDEFNTVDPLLPLSFLNNLLSNMELYLGSPLTEEAIRDNFDIVYQLMEEMLDESGHPLNTEYNSLRDIVREPSWVNNVMGKMASVPG
jgi:AP-3 complex subunit mu